MWAFYLRFQTILINVSLFCLFVCLFVCFKQSLVFSCVVKVNILASSVKDVV